MRQEISLLYCGDDTLAQSARYLWSVFKYLGYKVTYVPSRRKLSVSLLKKDYAALVLSDYPSVMLTSEVQIEILRKVEGGTGFLMVGGWGSFRGYDGHYERTKLQKMLPVQCSFSDDRVNVFQGAVISTPKIKGILSADLDFRNSPVIGGYNKVKLRAESALVLTVNDLRIHNGIARISAKEHPLLVTGSYGKGRATCYLSDFAPHWSGGLADWGKRKIKVESPGGNYMEFGNCYVTLIKNIIEYAAGLE